MLKVTRYTLPLDQVDELSFSITLPTGAELLSVGFETDPSLWAISNAVSAPVTIPFLLWSTNNDLPINIGDYGYLGSITAANPHSGSVDWVTFHVFYERGHGVEKRVDSVP